MDKLSAFFTAIGDFLNATSWYRLIQWPFCTLLVILAFCGCYAARFGKGKLLCLAFQSALKLTLLYMLAAVVYVRFPEALAKFSQLPFLSLSEDSLSLMNPLSLLKNPTTTLPYVTVHLYFLLFCINMVGTIFDYTPANFMTWLGFEALYAGGGLFAYSVISYLARRFWPGPPYMFAGFLAILLLAIFAYLGFGKIYYTFVKKSGSSVYQSIYEFLVKKKYGSQLTISALAFLLIIAYIFIAILNGHAILEFESFNKFAHFLNCTMCAGTLYIFSHYFAK